MVKLMTAVPLKHAAPSRPTGSAKRVGGRMVCTRVKRAARKLVVVPVKRPGGCWLPRLACSVR